MVEKKWIHFKEIKKDCPDCGNPMHLAMSLKNGGYFYLHDKFRDYAKCLNIEPVLDENAHSMLTEITDPCLPANNEPTL